MKVLVIPDVHGSHEWESVKGMPTDSYDFIVFMGDYFDSWENQWPDQGNNFKSICTFVREDRTHRKLLLGNHDILDIAFECDDIVFSHDETFNYAFEELLDWYGFFSSSGNEITQGPLWIRPEALIKDAAYPVQVVGHTKQEALYFV